MTRFVNLNEPGMRVNYGGSESPGFLSHIKNNISGLSSTAMFGIIAVVVFAIVAGLYVYYYLPSSKVNYKPNSEHIPKNSANSGKEAELLFFYVDWCPHCKTAKPIWDDLKSEYESKTIHGYKVVFTEINCTEETAEVEKLMNQYNIEGFPTIKLIKDGNVIEYDAKPSKDTLVNFLNTILSVQS
jgi:thiol-disulfide isomerase/thioredoxin